MKRIHGNFAIDAAAFVAFVFLLSTGLLLRYEMLPGSGRLEGAGTGRGAAERSVTLLWGRTRHDWGDIHYWIACALMVILAGHLVLHWKWVLCVIRGTPTDASGWRLGLGAVALVAVILMAAAPWMSPTQRTKRGTLREQADAPQGDTAATQDATSDIGRLSDQLRGSMSLQEVASLSGRPISYLVEQLDLPEDVSPTSQVGPLLRSRGLRMSDLLRVIAEQDSGPFSPGDERDKEALP